MFPDKDTDRQYIQKSLGMSRSLFSNLCRDAVVLYFLSDSLQDMWAHPRSPRMGEMRRHMRLPAWGSRRRTCVKTFDFSPQYVVWTRHHRGWTRRGFNQGPFHSSEKSGKRRWKRRRGEEEKRRRGEEEGFGEMNVSKADDGVPRMSRHWRQPVISPGDGFGVWFSSGRLSVYVRVCPECIFVWGRIGEGSAHKAVFI